MYYSSSIFSLCSLSLSLTHTHTLTRYLPRRHRFERSHTTTTTTTTTTATTTTTTTTASVLMTTGDVPIKSNHEFKKRRRQRLLRVLEEQEFDVILIEMYPFGRRAFKFELKPFLNKIHSLPIKPVVLCSIRDILVKTNHPTKHADMADVVEEYFDRIFVHSDPKLIPFSDTFSEYHRIQDKITYTGFVTPKIPQRTSNSSSSESVVISCGSGLTGNPERFFEFCLDALSRVVPAIENITCLRGPLSSESDCKVLSDLVARKKYQANIKVLRHVPGGLVESGLFPYHTTLSISMGGYNTTLESLKCKIPTILIPFHSEKDQEQLQRARILERHVNNPKSLCVLTSMDDLNCLIRAVTLIVSSSSSSVPVVSPKIHLQGADVSARLILEYGKIVESKRTCVCASLSMNGPLPHIHTYNRYDFVHWNTVLYKTKR